MSRQLQRITRTFGTQPFSVETALHAGFGRGALRNRALARPHRGVRVRDEIDASLVSRALALLPKLRPGDRFSHATALALLGCPIRVRPATPVDVSSIPGTTPMRRAGVAGHRSENTSFFALQVPARLWTNDGALSLPVSLPAAAVGEAAAMLPGPELVVAIDSLLHRGATHSDSGVAILTEHLLEDLRGAPSSRGVVRLRIALRLARHGAESRMETLLRLIGERVGISDLTLQGTIRSGDTEIGRFDLTDERTRSYFEYDGGQHRTSRSQYLRDIARYDGARDAGWRGVRFHSEDVLLTPDRTAERMLVRLGRVRERIPASVAEFLAEGGASPLVPAAPGGR
ncbi:hypothetical protein ACWGOE_12000 [Leucobacter chromiiresistens]